MCTAGAGAGAVAEKRHGVRLAVVIEPTTLRVVAVSSVLRLRLGLLRVGHATGAAAGLGQAPARRASAAPVLFGATLT